MKTGKTKIQWIAGAAAAGGFCFLLLLVLSGKEGCLDDPIRHFFYGLRSDALTPLAIGITDLSNTKFIIALCLILLILPQTRNIYGIPVSMGAIFVTILNKTIKHIIQRLRPEDIEHLVQEGGYSFPSGHSITSMFVYGMLLYLIWIHVKGPAAQKYIVGPCDDPAGPGGTEPDLPGRPLPYRRAGGLVPGIRSIDGSHWSGAADYSRTREKIFTKIFAEKQ